MWKICENLFKENVKIAVSKSAILDKSNVLKYYMNDDDDDECNVQAFVVCHIE